MKKVIYIIVISVLLVGCTNNVIQSSYYDKLDDLKLIESGSSEYDYDIEFIMEPLDDEEYIYQVIIDEASVLVQDLKVIIYHNALTNDIFPSYGFDNEKTENFKGINLVGYIKKESLKEDFTLKVMVIINNSVSYHIFNN
jgi:hypothetical protein